MKKLVAKLVLYRGMAQTFAYNISKNRLKIC